MRSSFKAAFERYVNLKMAKGARLESNHCHELNMLLLSCRGCRICVAGPNLKARSISMAGPRGQGRCVCSRCSMVQSATFCGLLGQLDLISSCEICVASPADVSVAPVVSSVVVPLGADCTMGANFDGTQRLRQLSVLLFLLLCRVLN